jgi:hypothetical protein
MFIRGPIRRDFFEEEPYSVDWVGPAIVLIAILAGIAALFFGLMHSEIPPIEFEVFS